MDLVAFFTSITGIVVLFIAGFFLWKIWGKGTGEHKGTLQMIGKVLVVVAVALFVLPYLAATTPTTTTVTDDGIATDYSIVWAYDSTTAVISTDFAQTDECGAASGEYSFSYDEKGNTVGVNVVNTCTALGACTWDAFSFTNTITANFPSEWKDGARVTSVLTASIDNSILDWGVVSNRTSINVPFIDRNPLDVSGLIWVDGATANKAIGATTGQLNLEELNLFN